LAEFQQVQASLSSLVLADKGLRLTKAFRQVGLTEPGFAPDVTKEGLEALVLGCEEALIHAGYSTGA